ncbi:MAG TPA: hypothetical protein PLR25_13070, partial [Planctomycetaceae bacterium]|nr:hypothetical protein [Planctomycetaceae bacterium]
MPKKSPSFGASQKMSLQQVTPSSSRNSAIRTALIVATILSVGLGAMTTNCADPDLWGHVQYGREVLRDGTLPMTTTWSFAAEGAQWVNHENIAELMLAWTVEKFGMLGLPVMKLILAIIILGLVLWTARRANCDWLAIGITVLLTATNLQFHWHFRPQILSYVSLAAMLAIWHRAFHCPEASFAAANVSNLRRQMRWLWLLPPLMCFWTNSHGGFAAGVAILIAYHGMIALQLLLAHGRSASRAVLMLSLVSVISVAATLVNPYGLTLWKFMLAALKLPRPEIADWGPLELWTFESVRFWMLLVTTAGGFAFALRQHRRTILTSQFLSQGILTALLFWQGISHCRHLSIVALVCGFFVPLPLHMLISFAAGGLNRRAVNHDESIHRKSGEPSVLLPATLTLILLFNVARLAPLMTDVPVERNEFPISAMQFMHDNDLHGKVVVTFNWAQYAIGCFAAEPDPAKQSRVAVDGRFETCYPREITDIYFDFWIGTDDPAQRYRSPKTGPFDPALALEFASPDLVLLSREQGPSVRAMQKHTDRWALLYQDSMAQLWGRKSIYDDPTSPAYLPQILRKIGNVQQSGAVSWPALPVPHERDIRTTMTGHSAEKPGALPQADLLWPVGPNRTRQTSQQEAAHVEAVLHHRERHLAEVLKLLVTIRRFRCVHAFAVAFASLFVFIASHLGIVHKRR